MSTPVLNNGLFLRQNNYVATSHIDSYHLSNMLRDTGPDDMGIIDLWCMTKKVDAPLYSAASLQGKNVQLVEDLQGRWSWKIPVTNDLPFVVEDIDSSNTTKGVDGARFKMKFNRKEFGRGDIITYDKFSGVEVYIDPSSDIIDAGDHCIYTCRLVNNDSVQYLSNDFLASGTKWFRAGSARGEYGQEFSELRAEAGYREFYNYLSNASAHVHYTVSSRVKMIELGGLNADGTVPVTEIWKASSNLQKQMDPSVTSLKTMAEIHGEAWVKKAMDNGDLGRSFLTNMEAKHITKVVKDVETYIMWGKGGKITQDGPDDIRLTVGMWKQLDTSYLTIYNISSLSLDSFRNALYNYFHGKVELDGPDPGRTLEVQTGIGGSQLLNTLVLKEASNLGWIVNADKSGLGAITGEGMKLGYGFAFTSIIIPYFATLVFKINPALDPVNMNSIENPIINGFPLSSYSFIIQDINDAPNNLFLKKAKWDPGFRWWYQNGTMDYMGRTSGFQSSANFSGFKVMMEQMYPSLWVKDPSKILKIVPRNPISGGHL